MTRWISNVQRKVNVTLWQATKGLQRGRGIALLILNLGARRGGWSAPRPGRFTPEKDPVPIVQEAGSGRVRKISSPPEFNPQTVHPVVSRYTDWATGPMEHVKSGK
jgi:hypothetical protein